MRNPRDAGIVRQAAPRVVTRRPNAPRVDRVVTSPGRRGGPVTVVRGRGYGNRGYRSVGRGYRSYGGTNVGVYVSVPGVYVNFGYGRGYPYRYRSYGYSPYVYRPGYYAYPYRYPYPYGAYRRYGGPVVAVPYYVHDSHYDEGFLQLKMIPRHAHVYVDGYYAGTVDQYDGVFQRLHLEPGPHQIDVVADGYEPITFEVLTRPGETITYEGALRPAP